MSPIVKNLTKRFTARGTQAKSEIEALGSNEGDLVMANLREAKVFMDYSI